MAGISSVHTLINKSYDRDQTLIYFSQLVNMLSPSLCSDDELIIFGYIRLWGHATSLTASRSHHNTIEIGDNIITNGPKSITSTLPKFVSDTEYWGDYGQKHGGDVLFFWQPLNENNCNVPADDYIVVAGDLNSHVCRSQTIAGSMGGKGLEHAIRVASV